MRLILAYQLHGLHLGRTAESTCGESIDKSLDAVGIAVHLATHAAHQVDYMAVILHLLISVHPHIVAVARQVVACQVHQHHVLGILLGVIAQILSVLLILHQVAGALGGARYGVDVGAPVADAAVGLGRRAEDAEASEVEIKQVGRGIDAPQCAVELEVVALILLHKAAADNNLEHIAPHAVGNAATDILLVLLIAERAAALAHGPEGKRLSVGRIQQILNMIKCRVLPLR